jgi:hypothetical protein
MNNKAKMLVEKWQEVLDTGKKITNNRVLASTALMIENEYNHLFGGRVDESGSHIEGTFNRAGSYSSNGDFYKIAIPMVRRTFPELIAHDLVGVQPMTGPVGLAFGLRFRAGQTYSGVAHGQELGYTTLDYTFTQSASVSAAEALGSKAGSGVGNDFGIGIGAGTHIKEVTMTLEKTQVTAETRKLRARWSLEVAQDLQAMHGLNMEDEMMDILSYEITAEIDRQIVTTIRTSATASVSTSSAFDYSSASGQWETEKYRCLYNKIVRKANEIAVTTRRGSGNWVVCHPTPCAALECLSAFTIHPVANDVNTALTGVAKLGSLDGRMAVYRDTFANSTDVVIGFKGASEYDAGVIYLPYIQLMSSKATFEDSFNPTVGLMSRYGLVDHLFGSALFYRYIICQNMPN